MLLLALCEVGAEEFFRVEADLHLLHLLLLYPRRLEG